MAGVLFWWNQENEKNIDLEALLRDVVIFPRHFEQMSL